MAKRRHSTKDEIAQRIEQARATNRAELDLSELSLTELPAVIGQLTQLKHLDLGFNQLTSYPRRLAS